MARIRYSKATIIGKLNAAGIGHPRDRAAIMADIRMIEGRLRALKKEFLCATSREVILRLRADPEFDAKRRAGYARMLQSPAYREQRAELGKTTRQPFRLPAMTDAQKRTYEKLRYKHKQPRETALAVVLG